MKKIYFLFLLLSQISFAQITIGQTSTFTAENDFEGWDNLNSAFTPVTVSGGYLTASGSPSILPGTIPPNRLIIDNITFWGGNYTAVEVGGITFKARNLSGVDMDLNILLFDDESGANITSAESTSISIPATATTFETFTISLLPSELNATGPKTLEELLADVFGVSITRVDDNGDGTESLDFDDIEAIAVSELSTIDFTTKNTTIKMFVSNNFLNIESIKSTVKSISIYNITGKLITTVKGNKANVAAISNGVYIAVIKDENNNTISKKFVR